MLGRRTAAAFVVVAGLFGLPGFASAHATPVTYEPVASSLRETAPAKVRILFSERVEPAASSISVFAPDGSRTEQGAAGVEPDDDRALSVGVRDAGKGTYAVSWQVVSADDGHFTKGAFTFSVGVETVPAAGSQGFQISHSSTAPEAAMIWLELLGHAMLSALLVLLWCWRLIASRHRLGSDLFGRRATAFAAVAAAIGTAGAAGLIVLKSSELSLAQGTSFAAAVPRYLSTTAGLYAALQGVSLLAAGALWVLARKKLHGPRFDWPDAAMIFLLLVDAFARARVSHAAASHLFPVASVAVQWFHLLAKDLWIGGGIAMAVVVAPALAKQPPAFMEAARTWSRIAAVAIGAAGVTGAYVVWLHLKDPANLFTTDWGGRFMLLGLAGALHFAVRLGEMLFIETRLASPRMHAVHSRLLGVEGVIGACMLFATALMVITTPPLTRGIAYRESLTSEGLRIVLEEAAHDRTALHVRVEDAATGAPTTPSDVIVTLENAAAGIGPIVAGVEQRAGNVFAFPESLMTPAGEWRIGVTARRSRGYDANASFVMDHPRTLEEGRRVAETRTYGWFDLACAFMAALFALLGLALYRLASRAPGGAGKKEEGGEAGWSPVHPAIAAAVVVPIILFGARVIAFEGSFQKRCEADGNLWNMSVPLRAGAVMTPQAVYGCSVGMGAAAHHFADEAEYRFYSRPAFPKVALAAEPKVFEANRPATLEFTITDGGPPATELTPDHERMLHVVIVSRDFSVFSHRHPEDGGPITPEMRESGIYPVPYVFPKAGRYLVAVDYAIRTTHGTAQFLVDVVNGPDMGAVDIAPGRTRRLDDRTAVTLSTSPATVWSGRETRLRFTVTEDGEPAKDLSPYLGAAMHIAVVRRGFGWAPAAAMEPVPWYDRVLAAPASAHVVGGAGSSTKGSGTEDFMHAHGLPAVPWYLQVLNGSAWRSMASHLHAPVPASFGPSVDATVVFPLPGSYVVFAEFRQGSEVRVAPFVVDARAP